MTATHAAEMAPAQQQPQAAVVNSKAQGAGSNINDASEERFFCEELEEDLAAQIESANLENGSATACDDNNDMVQYVAQNVIGSKSLFDSPFGMKAITYADFTASGKSLQCIEEYIQQEVMPLYGNTHTTTSITGLQTTCFRHEARQIIAQAVNAKITGRGAEDCVLFTGQGSTSAANKMVTALGLHLPLATADPEQRPVVFVGPFEHHSNLLPWRESVAEVVVIPENDAGQIDLDVLREKLAFYSKRPLKIGAFSAASNLTGILVDVDTVSAILHQHGALAVWDYATCAPYVTIDMNPVVTGELRPFVYKDAVFISGHKFIGGPGSPGVLVVKKRLLGNAVPTTVGGGTVFFVTEQDHRYLSNREEREEGGTPDILGSIRLGLAFELKQRVGAARILEIEKQHVARVRGALGSNENIVLLGRSNVEQLPIFSFLVRFGDRFLHYNFVCALLNDLFGIQTRGGCQCAGPYATRLLGLTKHDTLAFENALIDKKEMLRPGFSRVSFPYFMDDAQVDYIVRAIEFVAEEGWKFLPQYKFNHKSGAWKHTTRFTKFPNRKWLSHFATPSRQAPLTKLDSDAELHAHHEANFSLAMQLAEDCVKNQGSFAASAAQMLEESYEALRWFTYPSEAAGAIKRGVKPLLTPEIRGPYQPERYLLGTLKHQWDAAVADAAAPVAEKPARVSAFVKYGLKPAPGTMPTTTAPKATNGRETGGKYPLRSADSGASVAVADNTEDAQAEAPKPTFSHAQETTQQMTKKMTETKLFPTPPKKLMRFVGQAMIQWDMIQEGDRLLLGVSGGKDSLSLLHILLSFQKRAPIKFTLACATVDPQTPSFDPSPLKEYMKSLGVEYFYLSENIIERAACEMQGDSICSFCARMKRGLLYTCCRTQGYNKLVLAQHLDDLAESFLMSAMHNGQLRTMKAKYWNEQKDIEILRPLAYTREHELKKFAYEARLPVINENCPACFEEPKERHRVKKMLAQEESLYPEMYNSMRRALLPLMDDAIYEPMNAIRDRIEQVKQVRKKAPSNKQSKIKEAKATTSSDNTTAEESVAVETP
ncbi:tRNA 2-thiocytidine biosynthesis protein ttca, partial [Globisporangium splendens]